MQYFIKKIGLSPCVYLNLFYKIDLVLIPYMIYGLKLMDKHKLNLPNCRCTRCGHNWIPRKNRPIMCPNCKSLYWNDPYKHKETQ